MSFTKEKDFEDALVNMLHMEAGWKDPILTYPTEKDLLDNWAGILSRNNCGIDRLNNCPLTDTEMQQIMEQIRNLRTPLKLNGFINGKSVAIKRDNPDDKLHFGKEVSLKIYDRLEIAAGESTYQIVRQWYACHPYRAETKRHSNQSGNKPDCKVCKRRCFHRSVLSCTGFRCDDSGRDCLLCQSRS